MQVQRKLVRLSTNCQLTRFSQAVHRGALERLARVTIAFQHFPGQVSRDPHDGLFAGAAFAEFRDRLVAQIVEPEAGRRALRVRKSESQELVGMGARPSTVGIIGFHAGSDLGGLGAEILFVNHAILIDDEGFYA